MQMISFLVSRVIESATTIPGTRDLLITLCLMPALAVIAWPFGRRQGFLRLQMAAIPVGMKAGLIIIAFISPAVVEEFVFRALPIPRFGGEERLLWAFGSLVVFILYHPAKARLRPTPRNQVFTDGRFLVLASLLGLTCTAAYLLTNSLWPPVIIHWLAVTAWLLMLGGHDRMHGNRDSETESRQR